MIDVVIVNFRTPSLTALAVQSVVGSPNVSQVIVIDNGSDDDSLALLSTISGIRLTGLVENVGFAAAVNFAVDQTASEFILLLNSDAECSPDAISAMLEVFDGRRNAGAVGATLVSRDGKVLSSSVLGLPTMWSAFCFASGLSTAFSRFAFTNPEQSRRWMKTRNPEVPALSGGAMLVRKEVWSTLGGMNEEFFLYSEDVDFCKRMRVIGKRCYLATDARVLHDEGGSSASTGVRAARIFAGRVTYARLHFSRRRASLIIALLKVGVIGRSFALKTTAPTLSHWSEARRLRSSWQEGYPKAKAGLF